MSGPKCSQWEVRENLRRIELARQAALVEAHALVDVVQRLAAEVESARAGIGAARPSRQFNPPSSPRPDDPLDTIERQLVALKDARERLSEESAQIAATVQLINLMADSGARLANRVHGAKKAQRAEAEARAVRRGEEATRVLARIPAGISPAEREQLVALAQVFVSAASDGAGRGAELELRRRVQVYQDAQRTKALQLRRVGELQARLRGLDGSQVSEARAELAAVERGERQFDSSFDQRVVAIAANARQEADREYALEVLRSEFAGLGYEVGEEFTTVFMRGGTMVLSRAGSLTYGVEVGVQPDSREINTRLVRMSVEEMAERERAIRDKEAEENWCEEYARILAGAERRMVRARIIRREPPGASAVPLSERARDEGDRRRRSAANQGGLAARRTPSADGGRTN